MLGIIADQLGRQVGRLKRGRRVRVAASPVKVNIGSGVEVADGWIHVDGGLHALFAGGPRPLLRWLHRSSSIMRGSIEQADYVRRLSEHRFIHHELEAGLPFDDDSVDYIFCSHVLEHFFRPDGDALLRELHRVLRPGGVARVCVPDLEHALRLYAEGSKTAALEYFFVDGPAGYYHRHRYLYDFELLRDALTQAGFADVRRAAYREGAVPDLEVLDNRPEETLYVEAHKAAADGPGA
jgi:predicted SAM-dependent methyltransferase